MFPGDKEFWTEFIEIYKNNPCLWKVKHIAYTAKHAKRNAYEALVDKLKERDPDANIYSVRRKINTLRTSFRREHRKVMEAEKKGMTYTPILWYYHIYTFVKDQSDIDEEFEDFPLEIDTELNGSNEQPMDEEANRVDQLQFNSLQETNNEMRLKTDGIPSTPLAQFPNLVPTTFTPTMFTTPTVQPPPFVQPAPFTPPSSSINQSSPLVTFQSMDEWDMIGKNVTTKMRRLPPDMQIRAERLISEVLYEAQRGFLSDRSKICSIEHFDPGWVFENAKEMPNIKVENE